MFQSGETTGYCKRLRRSQFSFIPRDAHNLRGYTKLAGTLLAESNETQTWSLEPSAWMEAFGYRSSEEQERINKRLIGLLAPGQREELEKLERIELMSCPFFGGVGDNIVLYRELLER